MIVGDAPRVSTAGGHTSRTAWKKCASTHIPRKLRGMIVKLSSGVEEKNGDCWMPPEKQNRTAPFREVLPQSSQLEHRLHFDARGGRWPAPAETQTTFSTVPIPALLGLWCRQKGGDGESVWE